MPRNKHKTHCQVPGCRNWAMRGHTRCRAHREAELGPRPGGAPRGNLNALKTAKHAHPLREPDLYRLGRQLVDQPDLLPYHLGLAAQSIQARVRDPHQTLLAFRTLLADLQPCVALHQLSAELRDFLQKFPPAHREQMRILVLAQLRSYSPERQLLAFRRLAAGLGALRRPSSPDEA